METLKNFWSTTKDLAKAGIVWLKCAVKSRTIMFSVLVMVFGVAQANFPYMQAFFTPKMFGSLTMLIGMICGILRIVTTVPLSQK